MKQQTVHFMYVVIILVLALIVLVATEWGKIPDVAMLLSFGLTLTSLVLSLVAIIFMLLSHFSFAKSTADLQSASKNVSKMSNKLNAATDNIDKKISCLPDLIKSVESVKKGQELLLSKKDEKLSTQTVTTPISENIKKDFLECVSYYGLLTLYACKLSKDKTKQFKLENIAQVEKDYAHGFMVACGSLGILKFDTEGGVFLVRDIDEYIKDNVRTSITNSQDYFVKKDSKVYSKEKMESEVTKIEVFFTKGE